MEMKYSAEELIPLPTIKMYLTGHIKAGKTELRRNFGRSKCGPRQSLHQRVEEGRERTAGIEVENLEHDEFGSIVAYDLAGHCEYTASHSVVIDCGSNSVFLILYDVTGELQHMKEKVGYWAAFIKAGMLKSSTPHIILVGTHRDSALALGKTVLQLTLIHSCILQTLRDNYGDDFFLSTEDHIIVNCQDSASREMDLLRKAVGRCCDDIKKVKRNET